MTPASIATRDAAMAKLRDGYRLRVRVLTGGLRFAFLQSPSGSTSHTHIVDATLADALIRDGTVVHRRQSRHGTEIYALAGDVSPET